MPAYGASLAEFAEGLKKLVREEVRDESVDIAIYLGLAYLALQRLKARGVNPKVGRREIIGPALEEAWRDLLYTRHRLVPDSVQGADVRRPVTLSKTGKILYVTDSLAVHAFRQNYWDPNDKTVRRKRDVPARRKRRVRPRRVTEPDQPTDAGDSN